MTIHEGTLGVGREHAAHVRYVGRDGRRRTERTTWSLRLRATLRVRRGKAAAIAKAARSFDSMDEALLVAEEIARDHRGDTEVAVDILVGFECLAHLIKTSGGPVVVPADWLVDTEATRLFRRERNRTFANAILPTVPGELPPELEPIRCLELPASASEISAFRSEISDLVRDYAGPAFLREARYAQPT